MIAILKHQTRSNDLITNADIDTFVVLLRGTTGDIAKSVKNRIEKALIDDKDMNLNISLSLEYIG
jgi:GGDEF domain-containing protein